MISVAMKKIFMVTSAMLALSFMPVKANHVGTVVLSDSSKVYDIDEVVVVEQPKEAFRLRHQPLSSTSISSVEISSLQLQDLRQVSSYIPSFVMPEYGSRITSSMYIRGIGSRINSPAVGIYVDGMPIQSKSAFNFHTYGVSRIDVLRGPQGSLYGMNTEGGLIRLYSKNPFSYQGTDVTLSLGTHLWRKAEVNHYHKLSEKSAFSLSAFYDGQNGFFRNQYDGSRADRFNEFGAKGRYLYRPTDRLSFDVMADYQFVRQNGFPYGALAESSSVAEEPNTNYRSNYRRNILHTGLGINYKGNGFDFHSTTTYQFLKDYMLMDVDYLPADKMHMEQLQLQNSLTQELTFKSNNSSIWHWTFGLFGSYQWLRTSGPVTFGTAITDPITNGIQAPMYQGMLMSMAQKMAAQGMPMAQAMMAAQKAIEQAGGVHVGASMAAPGLYHTPVLNLGVFHESNIDITDRLMATLGLRYDYTQAKIDYSSSAALDMLFSVMGREVPVSLHSAYDGSDKANFNQLLPKFGLTYKIDNNNSNVYATVSKGYRAGGFNIQMFSDILKHDLDKPEYRDAIMKTRQSYDVIHTDVDYANVNNTIYFKPETSWNYEVGTHLNLLDNSLHLDASLFYMQIRDQQLSVMADDFGYGRMMTNAGKSHSCGLELSARGNAFDNHLAYSLGYGFTSAEFDEYSDSVEVNGINKLISYEDKKVPYVPMHTLSATLDYRFDIHPSDVAPSLGSVVYRSKKVYLRSVTIGANVVAQGTTYWDEENTMKEPFYATLGAHADADFGLFNLNVWVRNLTNTRYNTFAVGNKAAGDKNWFAQRGNPCQMGIDLSFHF